MKNTEIIKAAMQDLNTLPALVETNKNKEFTNYECGCAVMEIKQEFPAFYLCNKHSENEVLLKLFSENKFTNILRNPKFQTALIVALALLLCLADNL